MRAMEHHLARMAALSRQDMCAISRCGGEHDVSFSVQPMEISEGSGGAWETISVHLAALLERICRHILEDAGKHVREESPRRRIAPCHVSRAVVDDAQLRQFSTTSRRLRV